MQKFGKSASLRFSQTSYQDRVNDEMTRERMKADYKAHLLRQASIIIQQNENQHPPDIPQVVDDEQLTQLDSVVIENDAEISLQDVYPDNADQIPPKNVMRTVAQTIMSRQRLDSILKRKSYKS